MNAILHLGREVLPGSSEHAAGLCAMLCIALVDDCTPQGKRRRSELAEEIGAGVPSHQAEALVLAE